MNSKKSSEGKTIIKKDYSKKVLFDPADFRESGHLLQEVVIPARTKQRFHSHSIQTEIYYILEGECEITIAEKVFDAKPGDAFMTHPGDLHSLWNKSDVEFKLLVFKINYPNTEDTTWIK